MSQENKAAEEETVEIRFLTGTWYTISIPKAKENDPGYSPEELYDAYWNEGIPDDVDISEDEVDHIWED